MVLIAAGSFGLGILFSVLFLGKPLASNSSSIVRLGTPGLVDPLLYVTDRKSTLPSFQELNSKLKEKINEDIQKEFSSDVSVYFNDLNTSDWTGINESEAFAPASLLKVPVMMAYLKAAETNPEILQKRLYYDGSYNGNNVEDIQPLKTIEAGNAYAVDDLLRYMIEYSDNNADLLLVKNIGDAAILNVITDLRIPYPTSTPVSDFITSRAYSRFFRVLYSSTYLTKEMSQKALELLRNADFPQGIESGVPENIIVAQKFGERNFTNKTGANKELHNCGIVYAPKEPYVLCIMTRGTDFMRMTQTIHDLSEVVWQEVDSWN